MFKAKRYHVFPDHLSTIKSFHFEANFMVKDVDHKRLEAELVTLTAERDHLKQRLDAAEKLIELGISMIPKSGD